MCSLFWQRMENDQGDLSDIVRAKGGSNRSGYSTNNLDAGWQFPLEHPNFRSGIEEPSHDFGDPFSNMRDPLPQELDIAGSSLFNSWNSTVLPKMYVEENSSVSSSLFAHQILDEEMKRPCNIFSRMLQISPNTKIPVSSHAVVASPKGIETSTLVSNGILKANSSTGCPIENGRMQISPPRNLGIKRRKSQAKKVVCIPAPAAANSRPTGEVIPSDLWAWRKYGQKPIKGSPYPRGYYRCSSSKGCSARKQVERSRTDPNMLVITYTSEHNHSWPTQRNALAGSSRSHPTKNNSASKSSAATQTKKSTNLKEEHKKNNTDNVSAAIAGSSTTSASVKSEMGWMGKPIDMDEGEFYQDFRHSYRPTPVDSNHSDDLFAGLGEIEADPLNLLFSQGFTGEKSDGEKEDKALDPFSLFNWAGNTSFGEARRGL